MIKYTALSLNVYILYFCFRFFLSSQLFVSFYLLNLNYDALEQVNLIVPSLL